MPQDRRLWDFRRIRVTAPFREGKTRESDPHFLRNLPYDQSGFEERRRGGRFARMHAAGD